MTAYLFIGGPWDGQWISAPALDVVRVPVMRDPHERPVAPWDPPRECLYYRQRALVPGWLVPLTFYVAEPLRSIPRGTMLPGYVQAEPLDAWRMYPDRHNVLALPHYVNQSANDLHEAVRAENYRREWDRLERNRSRLLADHPELARLYDEQIRRIERRHGL